MFRLRTLLNLQIISKSPQTQALFRRISLIGIPVMWLALGLYSWSVANTSYEERLAIGVGIGMAVIWPGLVVLLKKQTPGRTVA